MSLTDTDKRNDKHHGDRDIGDHGQSDRISVNPFEQKAFSEHANEKKDRREQKNDCNIEKSLFLVVFLALQIDIFARDDTKTVKRRIKPDRRPGKTADDEFENDRDQSADEKKQRANSDFSEKIRVLILTDPFL